MLKDLMNVPIDYDDNVERRNTHPQLLPPDEDKPVQTLVPLAQSLHRRSVLGDKTNVSWSRLAGGKVPAQQPTTTAAIKHQQHVLQQWWMATMGLKWAIGSLLIKI